MHPRHPDWWIRPRHQQSKRAAVLGDVFENLPTARINMKRDVPVTMTSFKNPGRHHEIPK